MPAFRAQGSDMCSRMTVPFSSECRSTRSQTWWTSHRPWPPVASRRRRLAAGQRVGDHPGVADLADDLAVVQPDLHRPRRLGMPDGVRGDLADRDHEVDDAVLGQACGPGLLFRQGAYLGQVRGVHEGHGISGGGAGLRRRGRPWPAPSGARARRMVGTGTPYAADVPASLSSGRKLRVPAHATRSPAHPLPGRPRPCLPAYPTSVFTAAVISASAFFASAKYMLVFGLTYSSLSMPA